MGGTPLSDRSQGHPSPVNAASPTTAGSVAPPNVTTSILPSPYDEWDTWLVLVTRWLPIAAYTMAATAPPAVTPPRLPYLHDQWETWLSDATCRLWRQSRARPPSIGTTVPLAIQQQQQHASAWPPAFDGSSIAWLHRPRLHLPTLLPNRAPPHGRDTTIW